MFPPWSAYILMAFGLAYGWLLHRAALLRVYRITGVRLLDAFVLAWLIGLLSGLTPVFLYLAFGFKEFSDTPDGNRLLEQLHWAARAQAIFLVLYAVIILSTVKQTSNNPITPQDIQQLIVTNVIFALVAFVFTVITDILRRNK